MNGQKTMLMINKAAGKGTDPHEAVRMLLEYGEFRTTKEKLEKFAHGRDLRSLLTEGLLANDASRKRDSVDRNVRNWLRGDKDIELNRDTVFELAFIMELDIHETHNLLAMLTEEGLHWRDPQEIIMIYARMNQMTYLQAIELKKQIGQVETSSGDLAAAKENMTAVVRNRVLDLKSVSELKTYLNEFAGSLGSMHNTAYVLFDRFMKVLEAPDSPWGEEEQFERKMSVREVLQQYLYRDLVPVSAKKKKDEDSRNLTAQQKAVFSRIRAGWPDETTLSRMKSREIDVSRKVLILLFLATDGTGLQFTRKAAQGKEIAKSTLFRESMTRINRMLGGCGYSLLDPRSPFDWIVIYCLAVDCVEETDEKMARALTELFSGSQNQEESHA